MGWKMEPHKNHLDILNKDDDLELTVTHLYKTPYPFIHGFLTAEKLIAFANENSCEVNM